MFGAGFFKCLTVSVGGVALLAACQAAAAESLFPPFEEVYQVVLTNLPGVTSDDLNRAAVQGILSNFAPKVSLVGATQPSARPAETNLLAKASVLEEHIAYLRITRVAQGLHEELRKAYGKLADTNKVAGVVLDLRYADGGDYAAVAPAVGLFLKRERAVLNWGKGMESAAPPAEPITVPVAVLINAGTAEASEALAGALRQTGVAILLGSKTAGQASIQKDFKLQSGQELMVMSGPITLGDGSKLEPNGVNPDIPVEVPAGQEKVLYEDPFRVTGTNVMAGAAGLRMPRYNEAELVRERREGFDSNLVQRARRPERIAPVITDPVLARAADLLKGLAVIRKTQG